MRLLVLAATILSLVLTVEGQEDGLCTPTPRNLMSLYLQECAAVVGRGTTCQTAWERFTDAFAGREPSQVTAQDYQSYFNHFSMTNSLDNSLFWSRTPELVEMLSCMCASGANVVSSANEPATEIINNIERELGIDELRWCGTTSSAAPDGIEYNRNCSCSVSFAFFEQFSINFARAAQGTIFYLGYGERQGGTFSSDSFFARYEIPNLDRRLVNNAVVLVVHNQGQGESCGEGTLINLENALRTQIPSITYTCYDVIGDLSVSAELQMLTNCTATIIGDIQGGEIPDMNICSKGFHGPQLSVMLVTMAILISLWSLQ